MNYHKKEYEDLSLVARWLDNEHAKHAYEYALKFSSSEKYGLNSNTVSNIETLIIESYSVADNWLKSRISKKGTVQVVYSEHEVCEVSAQDFLNSWQDIFVPSRDDAIMLHNLDDSVLFYCHEEELEIGHRNT